MILRRAALTVLLSLALPFATQAQTVDAGGAKFETSAEVAGQKLVLNGAGVRYRAVFKVYAAGLYIKAKADTPDAIIKMDGAKRVQIKMLRDVDGKDLGKAFTEAMQKNMTPEDRSKTINGIFKFGQIFADIKRAPSGSRAPPWSKCRANGSSGSANGSASRFTSNGAVKSRGAQGWSRPSSAPCGSGLGMAPCRCSAVRLSADGEPPSPCGGSSCR